MVHLSKSSLGGGVWPKRDCSNLLSASPQRLCPGRGSAKQTASAEILVEIGPVDTMATAAHAPMSALLGHHFEESRVADQGNDDRSAIHQVHSSVSSVT